MKRYLIIVLLSIASCLSLRAQMNTDRLTSIGRNALYFDDYVLSIQYFNQVIKLKPYLAEPYLYRAIAKIQLGDLEGALLDCNRCIDNSPFLPGAYYARGYVHRRLEQLPEAEADFTEALIFSPENRTYRLLRADVRAARQNYAGALDDLQQIERREPQNAQVQQEQGIVQMAARDTLAALAAFTRAIELDRYNASAWSQRGMVHAMLEQDDEALFDLTEAINLGSKWTGDYMNRGIIYYKQHNYRGALADYDKAISLSPEQSEIYYNRGLLRQEVGDYNQALSDFSRAIELSSDHDAAYYQRSAVELALGQWSRAVADLDTLIGRHPYFLPAYYLAAQATEQLGKTKEAYRYRLKAKQLEDKKEEIQAAQQQLRVEAELAESQPTKKDRRKEFSASAAQNRDVSEEEQKYASSSRGAVQDRYTDVVNEPLFTLSYYAQQQPLRRTDYFHYSVDSLNRSLALPSPLRFTLTEMPLSAELVQFHFERIVDFTQQIDWEASRMMPDQARLARLYFSRAIEQALVQDYRSAVEDCSRAILLGEQPAHYFCRAVWRYRLLEYRHISGEELGVEAVKLEFELLMRDYDYVLRLTPDFSFAAYNKACLLCQQKDFAAAVDCFTQAIQVDPDFAEAYFNRGLTYIYMNRTEEGLRDLSKAGELGIYQAYNLISRFR